MSVPSSSGKSERVHEGQNWNFVQAISPYATQIVISETVGEDADNIYLSRYKN